MEPLTADDPRQISVYRLQSRLGAGGMGRVYLASSPGGRAVALKVVHPELGRDPEFIRRFRREVEAAEAVSGAYTAPVIGAGPDDSPPWLATAYVPGPSLADLVGRARPLPEAAVWRLAGGLTEALQAIHGRGLVHRDLKPGNILIAADGPRVIDFGISRALHGMAITAAQTTMGTPAYMSPEQAAGSEIGPASDIFSLGSVIAFAATGTAPFDGGESLAIIYRIAGAEPDLSRLPPALRALVAGCLAKNPASRPSLEALLAAVTAGAASFPPGTPGQFWPEPVAAVIAGQAGPAPAGGPPSYPGPGPYPVTAGGGSPGGATHPGAAAGRPGAGTAAGRSSSVRWLLAIGALAVVAAAAGTALALFHSSGTNPGNATGAASATRSAASATPPAAVTSSAAVTPPASLAPATTPAASPTDSLIAVTVCSFPADGCTDPGAAQYMEIRPKEIYTTGDGTGLVKDLVWSDWGSPQASATGTEEINNCEPNCAQGKFTGYPATVTLAGLTPYGTGLQAYSTIVVHSEATNLTETYTRDTVPR